MERSRVVLDRVVVTGGAGFIGSELVRQLVALGSDVTVVDNLVNGRRENLESVLGPRCRLLQADVRDQAAVKPLLTDDAVVMHLACLGVRHSIHSPFENHDVNATATLQLLNWSRAGGVRRFVYVSSSEVYGTAKVSPMSEDHPTYPNTVYGASKLAGECYARAIFRTHGFETVVVRPFNTYGPRSHHEGDSGEVIPKFVLRALADRPLIVLGDGENRRDFLHVSDTAAGLIALAQAPSATGQTVNLGSGEAISIRELAARVSAAVGRSSPQIEYRHARPGDVGSLCADVTTARRLVGFAPAVPFDEGLRSLVQWFASRSLSPQQMLESEVVENWEGAGHE